MKIQVFQVVVAILFLAGIEPALSQSRAERQRLDELDQRCEAARDAVLPAIIEWKVEQCVKYPPSPRARPLTREQCVRYWSDYGVVQRQRSLLGLAACEEAFEARRQHRSRNR